MFGRALLPLLARPKAIAALAAFLGAFCLLPIALIMTLTPPGQGPDPTERAAFALLLTGGASFLMGQACGGAISRAAMCSFAWTAPRLRQRLRGEFIASAAAVALTTSALAMLAVRPALSVFPVLLVTSVAAFAGGCAFSTVPEINLLFIPMLVVLTPVRRWSDAAIERPIAFAAVAAVIAAVSVAAAFATRTFRWKAQLDFSFPIVVEARAWLAARRRRTQGVSPRATPARPDAQAPARLPYADSLISRMIALSRATGPVAWLLLLGAGPLTGPVVAGVLTIVGPDRGLQFMVGGMAVGILGFFHVLPPSQMLRVGLPWSRRDHLVATWTWHAAMATWYAIVACLSLVLAVRVPASSRWTTVDAVLMIGSTLLLFPVGWRLLHRWFGRPNRVVQAGALLSLWFQLGTPAIAALLAALVPTPSLRLTVLSVLILTSQLMHWFLLKRDFATRDLAGASI